MGDVAAESEAEEPDLSKAERDEVARAWQTEVRRRLAEVDAGTARLVPAEKVIAGLRKLIEDRRKPG